MKEMDFVWQLGGITLIVLTIIAPIYYKEAIRWSEKAEKIKDNIYKDRAKNAKNKAIRIFKYCSRLVVLTIVSMLLPYLFKNESVLHVCKWILIVPVGTLLFAFLRFSLGIFWVPIELKKTE